MSDEEPVNKILSGLTQYDVLGYLMPGGATIAASFLFEYWLQKSLSIDPIHATLPLLGIAKQFATGLDNKSWVLPLLFFFAAFGCIYIVGHVVASVAALVVDRALVGKGYGYPYQRMLGFPDHPDTEITRPFYRCIFFWFNVYVVLRYIQLCFELYGAVVPAGVVVALARAIGWGLCAIVVVKLIASCRPFLTWSSANQFGKTVRGLITLTMKVVCVPFTLVTNVFARYLGVLHVFAGDFTTAYKTAFSAQFRLNAETSGTENYWLTYIFVKTRSPALVAMADNWLLLYSFARNLAAGFFLAFLYCYLVFALNHDHFLASPHFAPAIAVPLLLLLASYILLLRYYYLYASYYTKFVLRSFVFLNSPAANSQ